MITFSDERQKLHGQPGQLRLLFLSPVPLSLPPQGFPTAAFLPLPHAEKCLTLQKVLMQS